MAATFRMTFSNIFSEMKIQEFISSFFGICSQCFSQQKYSIDSDIDFAPIRRQAIILANGITYWSIYASRGLNELMAVPQLIGVLVKG